MKNEKMSLANMQEKLSRKEMKSIMVGSGGSCGITCSQAARYCVFIENCGAGAILKCSGQFIPWCYSPYF